MAEEFYKCKKCGSCDTYTMYEGSQRRVVAHTFKDGVVAYDPEATDAVVEVYQEGDMLEWNPGNELTVRCLNCDNEWYYRDGSKVEDHFTKVDEKGEISG